MLEWFYEVPLIVRAGIGIILLAISTLFWLGGWFWPWGWVVGGLLLLCSIPSGRSGEDTRW